MRKRPHIARTCDSAESTASLQIHASGAHMADCTAQPFNGTTAAQTTQEYMKIQKKKR